MLSGENLVLKPVTNKLTLPARLEACVKNWFSKFDLFLLHDETLQDQSGVTTEIWRDPVRPNFELRLVVDDAVPMIYLGLITDEEANISVLRHELTTCFEVYHPEDLLPEALSNPQDIHTWTRLAISLNGQYHEQVEQSLLESLSSKDMNRLSVAAMAAGLLGWNSFTVALQSALARPIPEKVCSDLSLALLACRARSQHKLK